MFEPWIGNDYAAGVVGGVRLMILGESHYGTYGDECSAFTSAMVRKLAVDEGYRFFTVTQRLVTGGRGSFAKSERLDFWNRVVFYNYIQSFPGEKARNRPTPEMWSAAREPFLHTIRELSPLPDVLLVLGHELGRNLPESEIPAGVTVRKVQHPSSRGFRYDKWQKAVQDALDVRRPTTGMN